MKPRPDFDETRALMQNLGFVVEDARSTPEAFGSWLIRGRINDKPTRVVWDGRERSLVVQQPSLGGQSDDWSDRWIGGDGYSNKPNDLEHALGSLIGRAVD